MDTAVKLKTGEILPIVNYATMIYTLSDFFTNNQKGFLRMVSDGDGQMQVVINNLDIKVKFVFPIANGVIYDRMFSIAELSHIVPNLIGYSEFEINADFLQHRDGFIKLYNFENMPEKDKNEYFNTEERVVEQDAFQFNVTEDFVVEIQRIFEILALKTEGHNFFFSDADQLYFGFTDIFVARRCYEQILGTDVFTLKVLYTLLRNYREADFYRVIDGKRFYVASDQMYFEGFLIEQDPANVESAKIIFDGETYQKLDKFVVTREFYNFLDTIMALDAEAGLAFNGKTVTVVSRLIPEAEFYIKEAEFEDDFLLMAANFYKVVKYIFKKNKKDVDSVDFHLVHSSAGRFLHYFDGDATRIAIKILS